ncbi:NB-ARC domain-containing protein [Catenulispora rubra]|uniref:NB-ARC domain-containing protein n=1 Tax=Catenulispora rubra TaxID=280293 RepID=UPI002B26B5A6|nr:NB-ARC domain-containing protein [Catenulispora rubra]
MAVHLAHRVHDRFGDGQLFVNLHGYDDGPPVPPATVLERFLRALGTAPAAIPPELEERAELYRSLIAGRRMLVVLDNAATAGQVRPLLPGDSSTAVVVTSRSRMAGLSARDGAHRVTLGLLEDKEAVALFDAATADYRSGDDPVLVGELARLCARLPLALRIAAERAAARPMMPLEDLIEDLRGESTVWEALSADDDAEADAVRTVFAWSYRALPGTAARAFRLLGQHPGPDFEPGAAAALIGLPADRTRTLLDALAGAHLIEQTGPRRFQFHDLLRAFAHDLADGEDTDAEHRAALVRLTDWYLYSADAAVQAMGNPGLKLSVLTDPPEAAARPAGFDTASQAVDWYSQEGPNILAVTRAAAAAGMDETVWKLAVTVNTLQESRSALDDALATGTLGLQAARRLGDDSAEARILENLGYAYRVTGRLDEAVESFHAAEHSYAGRGDAIGALRAANSLGLVHVWRRELDAAADRFQQAHRAARDNDQPTLQAITVGNLGVTRLNQGFLNEAVDLLNEALVAQQEANCHRSLRIEPLTDLVRAHREAGDLDAAERYARLADEALAGGETYLAGKVELLLQHAANQVARADIEQALETYWHCVQLQRPLGDRRQEAIAYTGIGDLLAVQGQREQAIDFHRRAVELRRAGPDAFGLADALARLADILESDGQTGAAQAADTEAAGLLDRYADPRATSLRDLIRARRDVADTE